MAGSFMAPRPRSSSFELILKKREDKKDYKKDPRNFRIKPERAAISPTIFLEVLVMCFGCILSTTSVVLLIFSGYLLNHQYAISLMTDAYDLLVGVILELAASVTIGIAAITLWMSNDPKQLIVVKLAKGAMVLIVASAIILAAEIFSNKSHYLWGQSGNILKSALQEKLKHSKTDKYQKELWDLFQEKDSKCVTWKSKGCLEIYLALKITLIQYLTGSACVALVNCVIVFPVLLKLYKKSKELTEEARISRKKWLKYHGSSGRMSTVSSVVISSRVFDLSTMPSSPTSSKLVLIEYLTDKEGEVRRVKSVKFWDEKMEQEFERNLHEEDRPDGDSGDELDEIETYNDGNDLSVDSDIFDFNKETKD